MFVQFTSDAERFIGLSGSAFLSKDDAQNGVIRLCLIFKDYLMTVNVENNGVYGIAFIEILYPEWGCKRIIF